MTKLQKLDYYRDTLGFAGSFYSGKNLRVICHDCEALVINGVATHERGCRNATHECAGCNEQIPWNQKYCADCA